MKHGFVNSRRENTELLLMRRKTLNKNLLREPCTFTLSLSSGDYWPLQCRLVRAFTRCFWNANGKQMRERERERERERCLGNFTSPLSTFGLE